jgi:hypothetical protein
MIDGERASRSSRWRSGGGVRCGGEPAREQDKMYKKVAGGVGAWHGRWQALGTGEEEGRGV